MSNNKNRGKKPDKEKVKVPEGKELVFCELYANTHNGAASARGAGYAANSARQTAYELLSKPHIKAYIQILEEELLDELGINRKNMLVLARDIAFFDLATIMDDNDRILPVAEWTIEARRALAGYEIDETVLNKAAGEETIMELLSVKRKVKTVNRMDAARLLWEFLGMGRERTTISINTKKNTGDNEENNGEITVEMDLV